MPESDEQEQEQQHELDALFSMLAAVGLESIPLLSGETEDLMPIDEAVATLESPQYVPASDRLEVLARMVDAPERLGDAEMADRAIAALANSLLHEDLRDETVAPSVRDPVRNDLVNRLSRWRPGEGEPLGRSTMHATEPDGLISMLDHALQAMAVSFFPRCQANSTTVGGIPALHIATQTVVSKELADFETIVDPREWANCWLQKRFFKRMDELSTSAPAPSFPSTEHGRKKILLEVVDFGALAPSKTDQTVHTELEFVYFFPADPDNPPANARGGCTYDLHHSQDGKILVDQGYLLVEDLRPTEDARRFRTLKVVHFKDGDPPSEEVCAFWSLAAGMILQGC